MPSIYCDICGAHFRKGKTFHEHLKKSKCTRVSALISVLQNHANIEVNNPEPHNSIKLETVLECQRSDVAGASNSKEASNQGDKQTDCCTDSCHGISDKAPVRQEKNESDFGRRSTNTRKIESVNSDSESSLSDTGFEEVEVTPNGDILIFSSDNDDSDFSDEVDWDYLESTGKVETFRQNEELQVEANSTLDEPSKTAKKKGETFTKRKKTRHSKQNFEHSNRSTKKQCLLLDEKKSISVFVGRPTTRSVELCRPSTKPSNLGRPATRSEQIGGKDSKFKKLTTSTVVSRKNIPKTSAKTVDTGSGLGRKTSSHIKDNKNHKRYTVCQNKPKEKTANKRRRTHSSSDYDDSDDEKGKDKAGEKVLTKNLRKRARNSADSKQNNFRKKNLNKKTLISELQNTQRLRHINDTLTDSKFKKREPNENTHTSNLCKNSFDKRSPEFVENKKEQVRSDLNKVTEDCIKSSANINITSQRRKKDKDIAHSTNKNMKHCRIQMTNNNASESDLGINTETNTTKNKEVTVRKNRRNICIESESSSDEDNALSSKGNGTDEDQDIEKDEADTDFFIESDSCSDSDVYKRVTRSKSKSEIPPTTETCQESTVVPDTFSSINNFKSGCELINQIEQTEDCGMSEEREELQSFVCGICHQSFLNSDSLETHIFTHCDNSSPVEQNKSEFICGICSTIYNCNEDLKNHMVVHMDKSANKSMSEPKKQNVSEGKKQKHLYTLICGKCKQEFSTAKSFHQHLMTHFTLYESIDDTEIIEIEESDKSDDSDNDQTENADSETCHELIDVQNENGKYTNDNTTSKETNKERAEISFDDSVNDIIECETSRETAVESIDEMNDDEILKTTEGIESNQLLVEEKTEKVANYPLLQELLKQNYEVGTKKADNPQSDLKFDDAQPDSLSTTQNKSTTQKFRDCSIIDLTTENDDIMASKINDDDMLKTIANKERNQLMSDGKERKRVSNSCSSLLKGLLKQKIEAGRQKADKPLVDALGRTFSKSKSKSFLDASIIDLTKIPSSPVSDVGDMVNGTSPSVSAWKAKESCIGQQPQQVHLEKESEKNTHTAIRHDSNTIISSNKSDQVLNMSSSKNSALVQTQNQLMIPVSVQGKSKNLQTDCQVLIPFEVLMVKKINQNFTSMLISAEIPGIPGNFSTDSPIVIPVAFQGDRDMLKTDQPMVIPRKISGNTAKKVKDDILIPFNLQGNEGKQVLQWSGYSNTNQEKIQIGSPCHVTYQNGQMPVISPGVQVPVTSQSEQGPVVVQSGQVQSTLLCEQVPETCKNGQGAVIVESGQVPVTVECGQTPNQSGQVQVTSQSGQVSVTCQNGLVPVTFESGQMPGLSQSGQTSITCQSGLVPVTVQSWQVPVTRQSGLVQVAMQSGQMTITSQSGQVSVKSQDWQLPVRRQSYQVPVTSQIWQVPVNSQSGQMPVKSQSGQVQNTSQSGQAPVTNQCGQAPVTSQSGHAPVTCQSGQVLVSSHNGQVPVTSQSRQAPGTGQSGQAPITSHTMQAPVTSQSRRVLVSSQSGQEPVTGQSGEAPVPSQSGQVPFANQSGHVPVTSQSGQVPVTRQSRQAPVTCRSGEAPVTSESGEAPVTSQSGEAPFTSQSGHVPVTSQSGEAPITNQSGQVPFTSQGGQAPVTSQGGQAPVTSQSEQVPVTSQSRQVPVTSQSGQASVAIQCGQVPVTTQSGQVPDTSQTEQVPVTSQSGQGPFTNQSGQAPFTTKKLLDNLIMDHFGPVTEKTADNTKKLALVNSEKQSHNEKTNTPRDIGNEQTISNSGHKEKQMEDSREMIINKLMNYKPKFFMH